MIFCNPVPVAASCYLAKEVVASAIQAFVQAVCDLTQLGYYIVIDFSFVTLKIIEKTLAYTFKHDFTRTVNDTSFEHKV
jgi:hypothetical protein